MQSIKRADKDLYNTEEPICTSNKLLFRYKNVVGKKISNWVSVHKNYVAELIPYLEFMKAQQRLQENYPFFQYECVSYNIKTKEIRFDSCSRFDVDDIPELKGSVTYNSRNKNLKYENTNTRIEHKWLLVKDDYLGFNVQESYNKSKQEANCENK